jgi:hypothetical protein
VIGYCEQLLTWDSTSGAQLMLISMWYSTVIKVLYYYYMSFSICEFGNCVQDLKVSPSLVLSFLVSGATPAAFGFWPVIFYEDLTLRCGGECCATSPMKCTNCGSWQKQLRLRENDDGV